MKYINISFTLELIQTLKAVAKDKGMPVTTLVRTIVIEWLKQNKLI